VGKGKLIAQQGELDIEHGPTYCPDANAFIDIYHAELVKKLRPFVKTGTIKVAEGVFRELKRKSDKLKEALETWDLLYDFISRLNEKERIEFAHIDNKYKYSFNIGNIKYLGLWATPSGKNGIDSQVIVLGKMRSWVVVSHDSSVKGACAIERVECITWEELVRRLRIIE
jgi:hypothetical protein